MTISELIFISIGLAMDSCTMATYLGMSSQKLSFKKIILIGVIFGLFQAIMPLIGYLFGNTFAHFIEKISHWIAFFILAFIGINMIKESEKEVQLFKVLTIKEISILAIATSIDALTVGITFAFLKINILLACFTILITTCILSILGAKFGSAIIKKIIHINEKSMSKFGGIILILMGLKIAIL